MSFLEKIRDWVLDNTLGKMLGTPQYPLSNGLCAMRFQCKNIDNKVCDAAPKGNNKHVECDYFEEAVK